MPRPDKLQRSMPGLAELAKILQKIQVFENQPSCHLFDRAS